MIEDLCESDYAGKPAEVWHMICGDCGKHSTYSHKSNAATATFAHAILYHHCSVIFTNRDIQTNKTKTKEIDE